MSIVQDLMAGRVGKYSPQQIMRGVQNGLIPAYLGIPAIDQLNKMKQQAQAMASGAGQQQPTIAQQVEAQAMQATPQMSSQQPQMPQPGVAALPSNLPQQGMAGGGIVAFADGGEADDEDTDTEDDALFQMLRGRMMQEPEAPEMPYIPESIPVAPKSAPTAAGLPALAQAAQQSATTSISEKIGDEPRRTHTEGSTHYAESRGGKKPHKYESLLLREADKLGRDEKERAFLREWGPVIANLESGGLKSPETAVSRAGAKGIMQLMPGTAREMGVSDVTNPEQNVAGGMGYLAKMGRMFNYDPRMALAAYNWGPGKVQKYGLENLPAETVNYLRKAGLSDNFAAGGEVKRFYDGGTTLADALRNMQITNPFAGMIPSAPDTSQPLNAPLSPEQQATFNTASSPDWNAQVNTIGAQLDIERKKLKDFEKLGGLRGRAQYPTYEQDYAATKSNVAALEKQYADLMQKGGMTQPGFGFYPRSMTPKGAVPPVNPRVAQEVKAAAEEDKKAAAAKPAAVWEEGFQPSETAPEEQRPAWEENFPTPTTPQEAQAQPQAQAAESPYGDLIKELVAGQRKRGEELAARKEQDKYLALMQMGFGMMGSKSPTFLGAVGEAGAQALGGYAAARKQQLEEEKALQAGQLGLTKAQLYERMHLEDIKRRATADKNLEAYRTAELKLKELHYRDLAEKAAAGNTAAQQRLTVALSAARQKADQAFEGSMRDTALRNQYKGKKGKNWMEDTAAFNSYLRDRKRMVDQDVLSYFENPAEAAATPSSSL